MILQTATVAVFALLAHGGEPNPGKKPSVAAAVDKPEPAGSHTPRRSIYAMAKVNGKTKTIDGIEYHLVATRVDLHVLLGVSNTLTPVWFANDEVGQLAERRPDEGEVPPGKLDRDVSLSWMQLPRKGTVEVTYGLGTPGATEAGRNKWFLEGKLAHIKTLQKLSGARQSDLTLKALGEKLQLHNMEIAELKRFFVRLDIMEKAHENVKQASAEQAKLAERLPKLDVSLAELGGEQKKLLESVQAIVQQLAEIKPPVPAVIAESVAESARSMRKTQESLAGKNRADAVNQAMHALHMLRQADKDLHRNLTRPSLLMHAPFVVNVAAMPEIRAATAEELSEKLVKMSPK